MPAPWYRAGRGWYVTVGKSQIPLNITDPRDESGAWAAVGRLSGDVGHARTPPGGGSPPPADVPSPGMDTIADLVAAFLADASERVKPRTLDGYRWYLNVLAGRFGTVNPSALTPRQVESDAARPTWSPTTRANYLGTVATAFAWAGVPLKVRKPPRQSAGADSVIAEADYFELLDRMPGDWPALVTLLWETGCRVIEGRVATAEDVDIRAKVIRLRDHKTAGTTGRPRLIRLNAAALRVVRGQVATHKTGLLFRNQFGRQITASAADDMFWRMGKRLGRRLTAKGFRHTYATRALLAGEPDTVVAALLGHSSTAMIARHYSHVSAMGRQLHDAAERIGRAG